MIFTRFLSLRSKLLTNPFKRDSACGGVYKVTCFCCKNYFRETGTTLGERIKEHQVDVNNEKSVKKWQVYHNMSEKVDIHLTGKK